MKSFLLTIGLIAASTFASAQDWTELMQRPNANFYEVQQKFNEHWEGRDNTEKGKGWKAFKRWENFVSPRVYPSGDLSLLSLTSINYQQWYESYNQNTGGKLSSSQVLSSTTWTAVGPFGALSGSAGGQLLKAGRLNFITVHPTNTLNLYVGAPAGGLWRSTNGGTSWTTNTDNLAVTGCSDLAIDPTNPNIMYLATGDGDAGDTRSIGVLKSTDGGNTWAATGLSAPVANGVLIRRLIINPSNPQILLAATNAGIYRTANGGTNWTQVATGSTYDLEFKPGDPNTVYAGGSTFRLSTNGGTSFAVVSTGITTTGVNRMAIAVTPANSAYVYVLASKSSDNGLYGIYKSTASGSSFTQMTTTLNLLGWNSNGADAGGQGWYDLAIAASPLNANEVVVGGVNVWRTTDGAASWSIYGHWTGSGAPFIHADIHDLEYAPDGTLFSTNDGTVYRRGATTWTEICGTMNISQIYKLGPSSLTANKWITGHQDNGTSIWNGSSYNASIGGDGMDCFIDRTNDNNMFGETYNGSFRKSTNGGASWSSCVTGLTGTAPWVTAWKQDPLVATTLYAGRQQMFKSTNSAGNWSAIGTLPSTQTINEFAVAPSNPQVIYVLKNGGIYKTTNGGTSWSTVTGTVPVASAAPQYVAINPNDPNNAWVVCSGYSNNNKIWVTTDGGASWTNISSGLPNIPANCVVYQPGTNDRIYVGMDVGVYYRDNSSSGWTLYNTGLPNTPISELEISPADPTILIAATYGRGVWKVDLVASNAPPASAFSFSGTTCPGVAKTFNDISTNSPTSWSWSVTPSAGVTINTPSSQNPSFTFSNAGNYTVTLVASNGMGPGSPSSQTIAVSANPNVLITNSVQTICAGSSATMTASGATTYSWNTGATTAALAVSPAATTVYTVTGTTSGCSAQKSATITVNPNPTVTVNSPTICAGNSVALIAGGASTYSWSTGAGTASISVSPASTTVYTVTGTSSGCTNMKTSTVTVTTPPVVTVNSATICSGSSANLTASGATSYSWNTGSTSSNINVSPLSTTVYSVTGSNGSCAGATKTATVTVNASPTVVATSATICAGMSATVSATGATTYSWSTGSTGNSISASPASTTVYTVTGTTSGCSTQKNATITVNPNPTVTVNSPTICAGNSIALIAGGASTYSWSTGAGTASISVSPASTTVYTVTGTSSGCTNMKTSTVTVTTPPVVTVNSATICSGSSANLTASGATSYSWNTGSTSSNINVSPLSTTVYSVTGSYGSCAGAIKTATVTVNTSPTVVATSATICAGMSATVSATGATSYSWSSGSSGNSISVSPVSTTIYTVTGTSGSCSNAKTSTVTVNQLPVINISTSNTVVCQGQNLTLNASGASTYTWQPGNSTGSAATFTPAASQTYSVTGTDSNGCDNNSSISIVVMNCTGLDGNISDIAFSIFPNPAKDVVTVKLIGEKNLYCTVEINDAAGKVIAVKTVTFDRSNTELKINTAQYANGVYFLKISTKEGNTKAIKLIKE